MGKTLVDPNKLCMGCMSILDMPNEPCPRCGFYLPAYAQVKNSMAPCEILDGKYLVGKAIGVGGFGITYIGWDFYQSSRVCIKEYFPRGVATRTGTQTMNQATHSVSVQYSLDVFTRGTKQEMDAYRNGLQTYIKEAETLSKFFMMPGIVSVRDFFYGNKTAYIVMEYIQGVNLKQYANSMGGRIHPDKLFPLLKDVFYALNEVHKENIIHRDISPDNIMLTRDLKAKLIDFGAAKDFEGGKDATILLKHGYAPIEQYDRNGRQGAWTDIYSLCATIYFLLSGTKLPRAYDRVAEDTVKSLQALGVPISEHQDKVLRKGMGIQIEDRYQKISELYYDLYGECLPGEKPPVEKQASRDKPPESVVESHLDGMRSRTIEEAAQKYLQEQLQQNA